jgi:hypothetical protein
VVLQVLAASSLQETPAGDVNWVTALPTVVSNMHDYFVATAAKLERTHAEVTTSLHQRFGTAWCLDSAAVYMKMRVGSLHSLNIDAVLYTRCT